MVSLQSLPLRPSTLSTLLRAGFQTTDDLQASRCPSSSSGGGSGGLGAFASECSVGLAEAGRLWREVDEAAAAAAQPMAGGGGSRAAAGSRGSSGTTNIPTGAGQIRPRPAGTRRVTAAALLSNPSRGAATTANTNASRHIVTFCRSIDALLGGGVALAELTELSGAPGAGKTQLAMQLCVDARLPAAYGGVEGEAVYVDSEGSFSPERCLDMAESLVRHVRRSAERRARGGSGSGGSNSAADGGGNGGSSGSLLPSWFNPSTILDGIHVIRVHDMAAQTCAIRNLAALLRSRRENGTPVRAVVIDSVAFHYRASPHHGHEAGVNGSNSNSYGSRTKSLTRLAATLSDLAREHDVAVLAVNQMTTKVGSGAADQNYHNRGTGSIGGGRTDDVIGGGLGGGGDIANSSSSRLTPALGESWSHSTTTRLLLTQLNGGSSSTGNGGESIDVRRCRLVKCPHKATGVADFQVNGSGIRDVPVSAASAASSAAVDQAKRQRVQ
jgi:RAD51-like protein 2